MLSLLQKHPLSLGKVFFAPCSKLELGNRKRHFPWRLTGEQEEEQMREWQKMEIHRLSPATTNNILLQDLRLSFDTKHVN